MEEHSIVKRVYEAKENIHKADELIKDYLPFIKSETSKAVNRVVNEGFDDEIGIAMLGFHDAINSYSRLKGKFLSYASVIMKRRIIDFHRKESRHLNIISLDSNINDEDNRSLIDDIEEPVDSYNNLEIRDATKKEILILIDELNDFELSLTDISENSPKEKGTLKAIGKALEYCKKNPILIEDLKRTKRLALTKISNEIGVSKKTLERHRKYLVALLIIYSNGFELIRGHLKQVLPREGGDV